MRRTAIAAAWLLGATVPAVASAVLLFGCCVLPFHGVVHKIMPICHVAVDFIRGDRPDRQPLPAREKQEPVKRIATGIPRSFHLAAAKTASRHVTVTVTNAYRSFITLGAIRCDQDVGLHLLAGTLLI